MQFEMGEKHLIRIKRAAELTNIPEQMIRNAVIRKQLKSKRLKVRKHGVAVVVWIDRESLLEFAKRYFAKRARKNASKKSALKKV